MTDDVVPFRSPRRRIVVTFPLTASAKERLEELVDDGTSIVDIRESDGSEEIVAIPSTSRQLIGKLRVTFPHATVLVVELEDAEHGVELGGPVMRALDAGADGYYVARSIDELAAIVGRPDVERDQAQQVLASLPEPLDDLESILDTIADNRARQAERAVEDD